MGVQRRFGEEAIFKKRQEGRWQLGMRESTSDNGNRKMWDMLKDLRKEGHQ